MSIETSVLRPHVTCTPRRVDHFKRAVADTKKRPNPYFGYAVALPLDLAPDALAGYFDYSYF